MLGEVNNLFVFKRLLTMASNVLPLHLKLTFPPIIWIFTEGGGDGIESRLPFKIFSTLHWYMVARLEVRAQNPTLLHGSQHERFFFAILLFLPLNFVFFLTQWKQYNYTLWTCEKKLQNSKLCQSSDILKRPQNLKKSSS